MEQIGINFNNSNRVGGTLGSGVKGGDTYVTNMDHLKMASKSLCLMVKKFRITMGLFQTVRVICRYP